MDIEQYVQTAVVQSIGKLPYLQNSPYLQALAIFVLFAALSRVFAIIIDRIILKIVARTETKVDDKIVAACEKPLAWLIFFAGVKIALVPIPILESPIRIFQQVINSIMIIIGTHMIRKMVDVFIDEWGAKWAAKTESTVDDQILPLVHRFVQIVIYLIGFLIMLSTWGVSIGPFLASLGIAGLAIGLALQGVLSNIFGGISLILDKNFKVGEVIQLESGESGKILEVGLRSTKIMTWDGEVEILPNSVLSNSKFINYAQPEPKSRIQIAFGVEYGSDVDKVRAVLLKKINSMKDIIHDPPAIIHLEQMGEFALQFKAYIWVKSYTERFNLKGELNELIYSTLQEEGIGIPFPTRTIYVRPDSASAKTIKKPKRK